MKLMLVGKSINAKLRLNVKPDAVRVQEYGPYFGRNVFPVNRVK